MRLVSDVPVGTFFSGGVDSSVIAYFLKHRDDIVHFSARKDKAAIKQEGTTSDFEFAERLSKEFGLNMLPVDIGESEANLELIRRTLQYGDDLIADGSQIPTYLITKESSKSTRVMVQSN